MFCQWRHCSLLVYKLTISQLYKFDLFASAKSTFYCMFSAVQLARGHNTLEKLERTMCPVSIQTTQEKLMIIKIYDKDVSSKVCFMH